MIQMREEAAAPRTTPSRSKASPGPAKAIVHLIESALDERDRRRDDGSFAAVDARDLALRVCARARESADARDVDVILHCAGHPVWVQPEAFAEALYELLANAVQATRRGYPVIMDVRDSRQGVLWQVQDAGDGSGAGKWGGVPGVGHREAPGRAPVRVGPRRRHHGERLAAGKVLSRFS